MTRLFDVPAAGAPVTPWRRWRWPDRQALGLARLAVDGCGLLDGLRLVPSTGPGRSNTVHANSGCDQLRGRGLDLPAAAADGTLLEDGYREPVQACGSCAGQQFGLLLTAAAGAEGDLAAVTEALDVLTGFQAPSFSVWERGHVVAWHTARVAVGGSGYASRTVPLSDLVDAAARRVAASPLRSQAAVLGPTAARWRTDARQLRKRFVDAMAGYTVPVWPHGDASPVLVLTCVPAHRDASHLPAGQQLYQTTAHAHAELGLVATDRAGRYALSWVPAAAAEALPTVVRTFTEVGRLPETLAVWGGDVEDLDRLHAAMVVAAS